MVTRGMKQVAAMATVALLGLAVIERIDASEVVFRAKTPETWRASP